MSSAAILLFGKDPQQFFPRARVRFVRYDGIEAKVGTEMNVIKDVIFTGRILDMIQQSLDFVRTQVKERFIRKRMPFLYFYDRHSFSLSLWGYFIFVPTQYIAQSRNEIAIRFFYISFSNFLQS